MKSRQESDLQRIPGQNKHKSGQKPEGQYYKCYLNSIVISLSQTQLFICKREVPRNTLGGFLVIPIQLYLIKYEIS